MFALELVTKGMSALEQRIGKDIVNDAQFKAGIDLLLTGIRVIAESVVRVRPEVVDVSGQLIDGP